MIDAILAAGVATGTVVRAACLCTIWYLAPKTLGSPCSHCGEPMRANREAP